MKFNITNKYLNDEELELVRTDSEILSYISYLKGVGIKLSPLGRQRRIDRLNKDFFKNFKK